MVMPTKARIEEYFKYEEETGNLIFKDRRHEFKTPMPLKKHIDRIGSVAGSVGDNGYVKICIDNKYYLAHRVIWFLMTGDEAKYPEFEIDHINGKKSDNRWKNLRKVSKSENQRNSCQRTNNTSGVHGVNWKPRYRTGDGDGRWVARIWNGPKHVYLGEFMTLHEASIARKAAERVLGFTRTGEPPSEGAINQRKRKIEGSAE